MGQHVSNKFGQHVSNIMGQHVLSICRLNVQDVLFIYTNVLIKMGHDMFGILYRVAAAKNHRIP